jgi:acetolactate synthase-1/2/3 large subunit
MSRTAAELLVECLKLHGVDRMFCVPGESYLGVLDAIRDGEPIHLVTCRHEGGAGFMALADAKLTGRAGVIFASRGPGATNASIALHNAEQDQVPLILLLGHVPRERLGRRSFQEIDLKQTFGDICKWVEVVQRADRVPEAIARAFRKAESGTPGPVVVGLPTDMLPENTDASPSGPRLRRAVPPDGRDVAAVAERIAQAERPLLLAGAGCRSEAARKALLAASEAWSLPVAAMFENQDVFPNRHPNYAGLLGLRPPAIVKENALAADLIVAVGTPLPDVGTQGHAIPGPHQPLVHVFPDPDKLGHVFKTEVGLVADSEPFLAALAAMNAPPAPKSREAWRTRLHDGWAGTTAFQPRTAADGMDFGWMVKAMAEGLPEDAIVVSDAGSFASWLHRQFAFNGRQIMLASEAGAMGFGAPGAVAAALRHPERQVVSLIGDGGFMMTGYELATAVRERAKVRLIVSNNADYGTIRFHQETRYPGRDFGTHLANPDFAKLAEAFGAKGLKVERAEDCAPALEAALAHDGPALIDVRTSLELITAATTITELRTPK